MISKQHRFHGHGSLNFVYRKGKTFRAEFISLRVAPSRRSDYRMAVVVSKKVSKSAVVRNRIRRRVYEIVRLERSLVGATLACDLVFTVFDERLASMPSLELHVVVVGLLQQASVKV